MRSCSKCEILGDWHSGFERLTIPNQYTKRIVVILSSRFSGWHTPVWVVKPNFLDQCEDPNFKENPMEWGQFWSKRTPTPLQQWKRESTEWDPNDNLVEQDLLDCSHQLCSVNLARNKKVHTLWPTNTCRLTIGQITNRNRNYLANCKIDNNI